MITALLLAALAQADNGPFGDAHLGGGGLATTGGALTGGIDISGACASMESGDVCCYDNNGVQCGWPTTDALADVLRVAGHSASPIGSGANLVGGDIIIAPGQGSMTLVCTVANCGAADTVSVTVDGTTKTCTRDAVLDDATHFTCGATDAAMATNVAACLATATGVSACAGAGCTLFTGAAGTAYVYRASNESSVAGQITVASSGNHAVAANGTDGRVNIPGQGSASVAIGLGTVTGSNSLLLGTSDADISGSSTTSAGIATVTTGASNVSVFGYGARGTNTNATAFGTSSRVDASGGVALGPNAYVGGSNGTAVGSSAQTNTATGAVALGVSAVVTAGGTNSIAIGNAATTGAYTNCLAFGASAACTANNDAEFGTSAQPYQILSYAGVAMSGSCSTMMSGDTCCVSDNGIECGFPTTNALADTLRIAGHSASPIGSGANLVGQNVVIRGGEGSMTLVCTQANCGAADTVSVVVDGTTTTCTRDVALDDATHFTCGASDAAMATNVAACLAQATGVSACAGAGCTLFTGVAGTAYVYRASNETSYAKAISVSSNGNHAVAANGTDGKVSIPGDSATSIALGSGAMVSKSATTTIFLNPSTTERQVTGLSNTILGFIDADINSSECTLIGDSASGAGCDDSVGIGFNNSTLTDSAVVIGTGATAQGSGSIAIGRSAATSTFTKCVALGYSSACAANNDFQVGGSTNVLNMKAYGTFTSALTTTLGWSVVAGANTACTTTCTNACVFGFDTGLGGSDLVDCADATADRCVCAGAN